MSTMHWHCLPMNRFLSKDPIGISGGLNQYVFCHNDPVNFVDPWGLCEDDNGLRSGEEEARKYLEDLKRDQGEWLKWIFTFDIARGYAWSTQGGRDLVNSPYLYDFLGGIYTGPQQEI